MSARKENSLSYSNLSKDFCRLSQNLNHLAYIFFVKFKSFFVFRRQNVGKLASRDLKGSSGGSRIESVKKQLPQFNLTLEDAKGLSNDRTGKLESVTNQLTMLDQKVEEAAASLNNIE